MLRENRTGYHLCVYDSREDMDSITLDKIISTLELIVSKANFLMVPIDHLRIRPPGESFIPFIKSAVAAWVNDLCKKFAKKINQEEFPEIFSPSNDERFMENCPLTFDSAVERSYRFKKPMIHHTSNTPPDSSPAFNILNAPPRDSPPGLPLDLGETEIVTILEGGQGDALTDDQLSTLLQLGHFR